MVTERQHILHWCKGGTWKSDIPVWREWLRMCRILAPFQTQLVRSRLAEVLSPVNTTAFTQVRFTNHTTEIHCQDKRHIYSQIQLNPAVNTLLALYLIWFDLDFLWIFIGFIHYLAGCVAIIILLPCLGPFCTSKTVALCPRQLSPLGTIKFNLQ